MLTTKAMKLTIICQESDPLIRAKVGMMHLFSAYNRGILLTVRNSSYSGGTVSKKDQIRFPDAGNREPKKNQSDVPP